MSSTEMDAFVEKVRERSDIYSVVSRYIPMTLKGGRYWACCPFHGEKTASFTITPDKGLFYCFGCHEGGNVFNFISKMENISYFEAVKLQAERLGIALPNQKKSQAEIQKEHNEKILFRINELARNFYHNVLTKTAEGEAGRKYLNSRGITGGTIENFKIGFAPNGWDRILNEFLRRGFTAEQVMSAGLVSKQKNGGKFFDRMRGRVIIPITDIFGHVVGFGGRILEDSAQKDAPKYLNTPETEIFNKGSLLFGLDKANKSIFSKKFAVIVEGYMDAISLSSAGFENVVATLGTAFTEEHAKLLTRHTRKIIFCYDSDEAGQRAAFRALPIVGRFDADVSVITIPDGKDPDEFVRKHGLKEFEKLAENSLPIFDYRLQYIIKRNDFTTIEGKINTLKKILPEIASVKDSTKVSEYCKKISFMLMLDESLVSNEFKKFSNKPAVIQTTKEVKPSQEKSLNYSEVQSEEVILRMLWHECDMVPYVSEILQEVDFTEVHAEIFSYLEKCFKNDERPDDITAGKELSEKAAAEISRILTNGSDDPKSDEISVFEDSLRELKKIHLKKLYDETLKNANKCTSSDLSAYVEKMQETLKIKEEMDRL
ncbi:MAG: DNA primase [Selenomonadaceae bacterium]|nr:DNA primase [Selenomonadaceae bacterium]